MLAGVTPKSISTSIGVIVGTAALFIILSGFSGLRTFNYSLLDISDPDIKITAAKGKSFFYDASLQNLVSKDKDIAVFSKVIEERVFIKNGEKQQIAFVKGVDYNYTDHTHRRTPLTMLCVGRPAAKPATRKAPVVFLFPRAP